MTEPVPCPQVSVSGYTLDGRSPTDVRLDAIKAALDANSVKLDMIFEELRAMRETQERELDNAHG